ncbi:MAG: 3-keto-5-aminohexanoate cleavage protein [Deltaproteobacteria bacterium]|nr:3-keto-5-aminohexanoate cleavage protein [Deltaproteobacteria bacterium]
MDKLVITVAVSGSGPTRDQNPNVPYSPKEIADEALRCWKAGAAVVHVHVRDPETGAPAFEQSLFAEVVERIRSESDMLISLTTSGFNITGSDVGKQRLMPVELGPDLCSLDVGTLNFRGGRVFINPPDWVETAAKTMKEAGVKPELEVFDLGHIRQAKDLVSRGLIEPPAYFQLCMGIPWGIEDSVEALLDMRRRLPSGCQWSCLGVGPMQLSITTHATLMGGHVRVGFEDNLYLRRGVKAESNAQFVERTVKLAEMLDRGIATCSEARQILGIRVK